MTWGEFKKWAEDHGAKDDDEIHFIDFNYSPDSLDRDPQPSGSVDLRIS